jgi:hypothetical protein
MTNRLKLILGSLALSPAIAFAAPPSPAQTPAQAPNKAVQAPAQAPTQAPVKTAQAGTDYRSYSYMPGAAPPSYGYGYGGYNTRSNREPGFFSGHQRADYKVRGDFWAR